MREPDNNADLPAWMDLTARSDLMHDVTVTPRCSSKINFPGGHCDRGVLVGAAVVTIWRTPPRGLRRIDTASGQQSRAIVVSAQLGVSLCLNGALRTRLNILQPDLPRWHLCLGGLLAVARAGSGFIFPEYSRIASCRLRVASGAVADVGNHGGPFSGPNVCSRGSRLACLNGAYADARRPLGVRTKLSPGS